MNAERTLAAVRAWKDRLITAKEASEIVGVGSEAELLSAEQAAGAGAVSSEHRIDNVRPFPSRRASSADRPAQDSGAFIRSRR